MSKKLRMLTRQEIVSRILRRLAIELDPRRGQLTRLAAHINVHPVTLSGWIAQGYVPEQQVKTLQSKFGADVARMDDLCPVQHRSN